MVGTVKQFDGHSPQASSVTVNAERKVSRWLELGVFRAPAVNGLTGMSTPASTVPASSPDS
jgi:hypothetical protein